MEYAQSPERLRRIMNELREQCPWDRKQTIHSLSPQTLEEIYERRDVIEKDDWKGIKEELGDLLLHIIFYSKIGEEQKAFTFDDVIEGIANKLVNRHPHIYSNVQVSDAREVSSNWEKIKQQEGKKSILSGLPATMPAMTKALRLQEKTKKVGFEWENTAQVREKVREEMEELEKEVADGNATAIEDEFGDVMFAMINYARFLQVDPDRALERTNQKFIRRFTRIEELAAEEGKTVHDMGLWEMDALWNKVKEEEKQ